MLNAKEFGLFEADEYREENTIIYTPKLGSRLIVHWPAHTDVVLVERKFERKNGPQGSSNNCTTDPVSIYTEGWYVTVYTVAAPTTVVLLVRLQVMMAFSIRIISGLFVISAEEVPL